MPAKVMLKVIDGRLTGQEFTFDERTSCIVGRADDCKPQVPNDKDHITISRHHCMLDINPPDIRVRDFGSLNGTQVNGKMIGKREQGQTPEEGAQAEFPEHDLKDGDEVRLQNTAFRVSIYVPARCAECSSEIPDLERQQALVASDIYRCAACRKKAELGKNAAPPKPKPKVCAKCGRDVAREIGENRQGEFVCAKCKADPLGIIELLLKMARSGEKDLLAIQGYTIVKELGRGGFGAVYLAKSDKTQEQLALKVMLPHKALEPQSKSKFEREVECTKALKHANVVELREYGCSKGTYFFTLEYCESGSVDKLMDRCGGKLSLDEAARITLQTLDGLEYAHNAKVRVQLEDGSFEEVNGVVHRDLKPANIFCERAGKSLVSKVADYGLAKAFDTAGLSGRTRTGMAAGTPFFMPRQQVINFKYSKPDVDVWAAAASLYNMLTGNFPRNFPRDKDVWQTVLHTKTVPIRDRDPSIPKKLAEVLDLALVDEGSLYFKTAGEFKKALASVL